MDPHVRVEVAHGVEQIAMPYGHGVSDGGRLAGAADCVDTGVPEMVDRRPFFAPALVQFIARG